MKRVGVPKMQDSEKLNHRMRLLRAQGTRSDSSIQGEAGRVIGGSVLAGVLTRHGGAGRTVDPSLRSCAIRRCAGSRRLRCFHCPSMASLRIDDQQSRNRRYDSGLEITFNVKLSNQDDDDLERKKPLNE